MAEQKMMHATEATNLADILERVLDKGIVIAGDIKIQIADIDLLNIKIRLLIASVDKAMEMGINWWQQDPYLSTKAKKSDIEQENKELKKRLERNEELKKRLERTEAERNIRGIFMRMLIYVPIIHTSADLGSIAEDVTKRGIKSLGEEIWTKHRKTVEGFWNAISDYFDSLDVKGMKIYQDGMVGEGEVGKKIVEDTAKAGSKNYQLVAKLLERGAILVKTEDFKLVKQEYDRLLAITRAKSTIRKVMAFLKYKLIKTTLLNKRDAFIAKRIDETLGPDEGGILFIGAFHKIKNRLPENIQVREIKDTDKVRKYQKLLPFHNKYQRKFDELGSYIISEI